MSLSDTLNAFANDLASQIDGDIRTNTADLALYSTDASFYRHVPIAVVLPHTAEDVIATVDACRRYALPILPRGAGTSTAGQGCNEAVVIDTSRYFNRVLAIDPETRTAQVEPGVILDDLRRVTAPYGLTFGPDPSTHSRCTLGGMIGNNACGTHSVAWGTTADNVSSLDVLLYDGTRLLLQSPSGVSNSEERSTVSRSSSPNNARRLLDTIRHLRDVHLLELRSGFPELPRRISGYNLDALLPEHQFDLVRALVGTEGTCATTIGATVRLVPIPAARCLLALSYADMPSAADHVPSVLGCGPVALEGMGTSLLSVLPTPRTVGLKELLPSGSAWMIAEFAGSSQAEATAAAIRAANVLSSDDLVKGVRVIDDPKAAKHLWGIREDGAGLASRTIDGKEAWPGWEDAAVPPSRLGAYLRDFDDLLAEYNFSGIPYGHFGDGCIHVRIDFNLLSTDGVKRYKNFVEEAAGIVVRHGGSLSGEHGDGQMRAQLLTKMYPPMLIQAFEEFKAAFDPSNRMNPGRIVHPRLLDQDIRFLPPPKLQVGKHQFRFESDGGQLASAARRCIGVGACRRSEGGLMCPSYMVTKEEEHSTRGRSRLLFEMLKGELISDGWRSREVLEALDLCLSCKGCRVECPVGVDMATYKAEFLSHHYAWRIRPRSHYAMGWLPVWLRFASLSPALANHASESFLQAGMKRLSGVDSRRSFPVIPRHTLRHELAHRGVRKVKGNESRNDVILWADTFTNYLRPEVGIAANTVLRSSGLGLTLAPSHLCCGLPWISTGQLATARHVIEASARRLDKYLLSGAPVLVLEPSCAATLRSDAPELSSMASVRSLSESVRTLAELLSERIHNWHPRTIDDAVLIQRHCHAQAILGTDAEDQLLTLVTPRSEVIDGGCCGLAGNFGFEQGHYDVSMACAERVMLPMIRSAAPGTRIVADGFSCQVQIEQALGIRPLHLAELLAENGAG